MTKPLILWVEDNPHDVDLVRRAFEEAGVAVDFIVPNNAVLAFHYMASREPFRFSRRPPDLILLDINLPVLSGIQVLQEVRQYPPWEHIPIVVFTSSHNPKEHQTCISAGAAECITKPPTFSGYLEAIQRLRKYLPHSGVGPAVGSPPKQPTNPVSSTSRH
jgi:CheY-like chemotaxis protein